MISFIRGKVQDLDDDTICIDVNGIGYSVFSSADAISKAVPGETIKLYTKMMVREDSMSLYGFAQKDELRLFEKLITVSRVGPKVALGILSSMPPARFAALVTGGNVEELTHIPGIGKKTGERIILELKDKLDTFVEDSMQRPVSDNRKEAMEALIALGFSAAGVRRALSEIDENEASDTAQLIKLCLKILKS